MIPLKILNRTTYSFYRANYQTTLNNVQITNHKQHSMFKLTNNKHSVQSHKQQKAILLRFHIAMS